MVDLEEPVAASGLEPEPLELVKTRALLPQTGAPHAAAAQAAKGR